MYLCALDREIDDSSVRRRRRGVPRAHNAQRGGLTKRVDRHLPWHGNTEEYCGRRQKKGQSYSAHD